MPISTSIKVPPEMVHHAANYSSVDMKRIATIILGGGHGTRLFPLTMSCCKPAACVGGKYKLIDIPISNAINSGCSKLFIITQFLSASLHHHISRTYQLGSFSNGFIDLISAEQRPSKQTWFQGTADAVRQNIDYFASVSADYFLILSGDQLYNMDFQKVLQFALETDADLVVAALPVAETEAKRMGLLKINEDRFITEFHEKPQEKEILDHMCLPEFTLRQIGDPADLQRKYLGSMGIYLFKREALFNLLKKDLREDFGKHLIPTQVQQGKVAAYLFDGYWEDIGTISSFFKANMALTMPTSPLNCYDDQKPIYFQPHHLPSPRITNTQIQDCIICEGAVVEADSIKNSILGSRTVIKQGSIIKNAYIMGNDFYLAPQQQDSKSTALQIGENCLLDRVILDKNVTLGTGVQLTNRKNLDHYDSEQVYIRDGIIIVVRGATIPDGFIL